MFEILVGVILVGFLGLFVVMSMPMKDAERLMNEQSSNPISDRKPSN